MNSPPGQMLSISLVWYMMIYKEQEYNLSVSTYVEKEETREVIDIVKLNAEIKEIVKRENKLRREIDKIVDEIEG